MVLAVIAFSCQVRITSVGMVSAKIATCCRARACLVMFGLSAWTHGSFLGCTGITDNDDAAGHRISATHPLTHPERRHTSTVCGARYTLPVIQCRTMLTTSHTSGTSPPRDPLPAQFCGARAASPIANLISGACNTVWWALAGDYFTDVSYSRGRGGDSAARKTRFQYAPADQGVRRLQYRAVGCGE